MTKPQPEGDGSSHGSPKHGNHGSNHGSSHDDSRHRNSSSRLVFLDFDGVICDSIPECYAVSWDAYFRLYLMQAEPADVAVALGGAAAVSGQMRTFRQLRPYIRRGGDYMFIQMAMRRNITIDSQAAFDALVKDHAALDDRFHELFYQARHALFQNDPERWYALNPLYPGIKELLDKHGQDSNMLILSTKEAAFISEILKHHGIPWDIARIHCSGKEQKLRFIDRIMAEHAATDALFIDDQIDHFRGSATRPIRCLLADWGYVRPEWLTQAKTVTLAGLAAVLDT